ncbi:AAA family ATPase [Patulibacter brassicae]|uniref:AAA family ATPase n=1 Tax=Patulibacter brassicae TaxID=1705717 RepID=A0ABU4VQT9_9ACTN|nr:AAA family ATPase [Patulibacter brassicae]MDX8153840.1 AAA family ATPase [Patulibacter brassicae]
MGTRVTSARVVGRSAELAELRAALLDAAARRPSLAFVAGESGVGKTRLVRELRQLVAATPVAAPVPSVAPDRPAGATEEAGALVLAGECVQLGDGELAYAPLVGALRPLLRDAHPVLETLDPATRRALGRVLPGLDGAGEAPGPDVDDGQGRLFEALLELLDRLAADRPLLLILEDLHWADRSTRAFLTFLVRSLVQERLLVVGTYRHDELHRRHPMRPLLAELERDARARRIELRPLDREELGELLADLLGTPPDEALLGRLHGRSEGNPLFAEELLAAGPDGRGALPSTLRDALMVRTERLPADAQELLRVIAVGQRVDHDALADVAGLDPRPLRDALREAVAQQIVVVDEDGRYAFRHALLREVVDDDLLPGERAELHRALATVLERRLAEGASGVHLTSGIAHHYAAAGDQPAALRTAVRAARAAREVHAHGEEADLLERALGLWPAVPDAEAIAGAPRVLLLRDAAQAHAHLAEHERAESLLLAGLDLGDEQDDPRLTAGLLERLARAQWALLRPLEALATTERALGLLDGLVCVEHARLVSWKAKARMLQGRYGEVVALAREALVLAHAVGDRISESRARNALGVALAATGRPDDGARELRRAIALAERDGAVAELGAGYVNLADALHIAGRTREAREVTRTGLRVVPAPGSDHRWQQAVLSELSFALGDWDEAAAVLPDVTERRSSEVGRLNLLLRHADLALGRGDHEQAAALLPEIELLGERSTEPQFHVPVAMTRARYEERVGDLDAARRAIDAGLDRIELCAEDQARMALLSAIGVEIEATAAQRERDRRADDGPARERASAMLRRVEAAAADAGPTERANLLHARADHDRACGVDDHATWVAVAAAWEALEYPYPAARAHRAAAEAALRDRDRAAAEASLAAARSIAERLGARWLVADLERLAARGRLRATEPPDAAAPEERPAADRAADPAAEDPYGLTPREREVLALVADGATNRVIGERLFMAEKTASVHVSRILAKLGVRSRTEAAGVAHRQGLVD